MKKIYIASKVRHAERWVKLRESGVNIISTWINETGHVQRKAALCARCIQESLDCDAMIVYAEEGEYLKGAFIEMGIALTTEKPIILVGPVLPFGSVFRYSPQVFAAKTVEQAIEFIR